jgi:hypothetical protein
MDSHEKDESKFRQRQESLAQRLAEGLDQEGSSGAEECPDAEVIAAYAEQALGPAESGHWEGHFATCARCRSVLRALAASTGTPLAEKEVAHLGELVAAARAPVEIIGGPVGRAGSKRAHWRMRWLAPALGVAAVLAVWVAMRAPWRATDRSANETLISQMPKTEAPANPLESVDRPSNVAPPQDEKSLPASPADLANGAPPNSQPEERAEGGANPAASLDKVSPSASAPRSSLQAETKSSTPLELREILPSAAPPKPPASPEAPEATPEPAAPQSQAKAAPNTDVSAAAQIQASANAVGNAPSKGRQEVAVQEEAGAIAGSEPARKKVSPDVRAGEQKELVFPAFPSVEKQLLKAPSASTLWRVGNSGSIERSTDAGKSWVSQASPSQEDWLAGAAVSEAVCWVAGRRGAIARTVDGVRWERISPPAQVAGPDARPVDWIGVTARDAQTATLTTSDGRMFVTGDGGRTWRQQ